MKYSGKSLLYPCVLFMLAAALLPHNLYAQPNFVYTNNSEFQNTVSGFSAGPDGTLTPVPGSPFVTGGNSSGGGLFAANRIGVAIVGQFLFAANMVSRDVSVFTIDANTGALTLVPGSPFSIDPNHLFNPIDSMSVAATPDGNFLIVGSDTNSSITVFRIAPDGSLATVLNSPFHAFLPADGIKVTPNGKFLAVAELDVVEMFSIGSDGSLTSLGITSGSNHGLPAGVDVNCSSSLLYAGEAAFLPTIVDGYHIGPNGTLTPLAGSPFMPGVGLNSNVVLLSPDDKTLFVSNQFSSSVTAFHVAQDGSLSLVPGSPFLLRTPVLPVGMATSQDGKFLYLATDFPAMISVLQVGSDGALTEVAGSPFPTGSSSPFGLFLSLTAFPPKRCSQPTPVDIEIKPPAQAPATINPDSSGKIPVAILSTSTFDALAQVDPASLTFGHSGDEASLAMCSPSGQDVNNDGLADLVCQFNTEQTGLVAGDGIAVLKGKTVTGKAIQGSEAIRIVPQ